MIFFGGRIIFQYFSAIPQIQSNGSQPEESNPVGMISIFVDFKQTDIRSSNFGAGDG